MKHKLKYEIILFCVMFFVGILFNPMNVLSYKINHLYISLTLIYTGFYMASNMIWAHEIVHYFSSGHFNTTVFLIGVFLSVISIFLLRKQFFVNDTQWLKRMISHHSTALTTSNIIYKKSDSPEIKKLSKNIIETQEEEIKLMKMVLSPRDFS